MRTRKWHMLENKDCGVTAFHMSAIASFSMCMLVGASYSQRVVKSERRTLICSRCTEYWMIMGTWIEWWSCFFFRLPSYILLILRPAWQVGTLDLIWKQNEI
jgi:hypothetical protein